MHKYDSEKTDTALLTELVADNYRRRKFNKFSALDYNRVH
jgi:hypothetical protein